MTFGMGKDGYPAICMTQLAAKMYCKWLSAKTGRLYRLPTEAEWEYACRAGTTTAYSFGDQPGQLDEYAWYFDNCDAYQKVGQKKPNPWGLHDMHGNVTEWVLDQYAPDGYAQLAARQETNPVLAPTAIYPRVVRGGSWLDDPEMLRSAARGKSDPEWKKQDPQIPRSVWYHTNADFVGFRVVRPWRTPAAGEAERYDLDKAQKEAMIEYAQARGTAGP
jgi:formylglycine-generating enzyme required for sulfatase activity